MKLFSAKKIAAALSACVLVLSLSGCALGGDSNIMLYDPGEEAESNRKISLTFFGYKADAMNLTATEDAMQSFMAKHGDITITYEGIKGTAYWEAFDKRDAAGVLDDIFMMHHDHVISMSAEGKLADLSGIAGLDNYSDAARGQFVNPDGTVYFLPTSISTYNLYVNYDLLKEHGQKTPENWAELQSCCEYFVDKGIVPIIVNNRNSLTTLIVSKGLFDVYSRPDTAAQLEKLKDPVNMAEALAPGIEQTAYMLSRGWFFPEEALVTGQTSDDLELFLQGDRPFMITGGWAASRVTAANPTFSYGVHPYPIMDDGCVLSFQVDTCISVNAKSNNAEYAKEFVEYLIQPDIMWDYCDSQASYTPLKDDRIPSEQALAPSHEYLTNGRAVLRNEYRISLPMESALTECVQALLETGSADDAKAALLKALSE